MKSKMFSKMEISEKLNEKYGKEHLSYSSLKIALSDMAKFDMYMRGALKFESDALSFGTLYDMLLFEPDKASKKYIVFSEEEVVEGLSDKSRSSTRPKATSEYKAAVNLLKTNAIENDQIVCPKDEWDQAINMIARLDDCGLIDEYLSSRNFQVEFKQKLNGIVVKGFLDCLGDGFIVDSKSTKSVEKFRYSVRDFSYDIQAYIYTKVFGMDKFYWLVQEKTYPYLPAIVECSNETLFNGEMKFHDAVRRITKFLEDGEKPEKDYVRFKV